MKRWRALMIGWVLLWTGCRAAPAPDHADVPVTAGFTCEADITYREMRLAGSLTRTAPGGLTLTFSAPDTLRGVTVDWQDGAVTASLNGLSVSLPEETLPAGALGRVLADALDAASRSPEGVRATEAALVWTGAGQNGAITLTADPVDGRLLTLDVPGVPLSAAFREFQPIAAP